MNEENKTEELKHNIYVNENGTVYISEEDVRNLFDSTMYYDSKYNQIITTSDTKVATIAINQKQMTVNSSSVSMLDSIIRIDNNIYLPISDMQIVYNIKVTYISSTKTVIIDDLSRGMIRAIVNEDTDIKFKPRKLSKDVGTINKGETVNCFYTTSKGWRQIRTSEGIIGYIKANKLGDEYIIRQDMEKRGEAVIISKNDYSNNYFEVSRNYDTSKVVLKSTFNINTKDIEISQILDNEETTNKIWVSVTNDILESQMNEILKDYKLRTSLIDLILKRAVENQVNGISIDFSKIQDKEAMKRFIIELSPKLRESGITTCIVLKENMDEKDYINVVEYIVE